MRKKLILIALIFSVITFNCENPTAPFDETVPRIFTLTTKVTPAEGGEIIPTGGEFTANTQIVIEARPSEGWIFNGWEGDLISSRNPDSLLIDRDKTIIAFFEREGIVAFSLTVGIQGEGTVDLDPDKEMYEDGDEVTLSANPAEGWAFLEWQEDLTGTDNPATLVMDSNKSVIAVFESQTSSPTLNITVQPTLTTAGEVISPAPSIEVTGPSGNPLEGVQVTVSEQGGFVFDSGTLTVTTGSDGVAEFNDLVINRAGNYTLVFSAEEAGQVISDSFMVNSADGDPSQTVADVPATGTAGESTKITITMEDQFNNRVEGAAADLSVSVSGANNIENVTPIRDDGNGVYSTGYTPNNVGSDQFSILLKGMSVTGSPFSSLVLPGPAAMFNFNTISSPHTAGESFRITIKALDAQGNEATGFSESADLSTTAGMITPESIIFTNGIATPNVSVTKAGTGQTITVTSGTINGTSGQFTVEAGPPGTISVVTQPELSKAGQPITGPPTTKVTDLFDNPVIGAEVSVSESGGANFDSGSLTMATGNQGRAVFDDLIINLAGSYSLLFKTSELDVRSNTFEIESSDGDPSKTTASVPSFGNADKPTRITITVEDSFGNRVEGAAGDLSVSVSGANNIENVTPINDDGNGVYSTSYTPKNSGIDQIRIQLNGIDISESPFRSVVLF